MSDSFQAIELVRNRTGIQTQRCLILTFTGFIYQAAEEKLVIQITHNFTVKSITLTGKRIHKDLKWKTINTEDMKKWPNII